MGALPSLKLEAALREYCSEAACDVNLASPSVDEHVIIYIYIYTLDYQIC